METIDDIVREIRSRNEGCVPLDEGSSHPLAEDMLRLSDRIEAAVKALGADRDNWRRQALDEDARANQAQSVTDCNQFGNVASMREALLKMLGIVDHLQTRFALPTLAYGELLELKTIAKTALAEPLRNCDVGTANEQSDRFAKFCRLHEKGCGLGWGSNGIGHPKVTCPAYHNTECGLEWAQMPYESEVK